MTYDRPLAAFAAILLAAIAFQQVLIIPPALAARHLVLA